MKEDLPSFKSPPVVETVLGVQFDPIKGLTSAHLGAFWKSLGDGWSNVNDAPALEQQFERFGDGPTWGSLGFQIKLTSEPSSRVQIRNKLSDRMIQVQNGRFHLNWLGQAGGEYPRYGTVRPEFDHLFERLGQFLVGAHLGEPRLNQWEVTYVNHILRGSLWESPSDLPSVLRLFGNLPSLPGTSRLEGVVGAWHFELPEKRGRLHVEARHGRRTTPDDREVLILTLTARGPIDENSPEYNAGLNIGREAIVRGFAAITTESAQREWEPQDACSRR